jgi:hypothetical protein
MFKKSVKNETLPQESLFYSDLTERKLKGKSVYCISTRGVNSSAKFGEICGLKPPGLLGQSFC